MRLKLEDPVGEGRGTLIANQGCNSAKCVHGVCGSGGIALSRQALMTMVGDSPSKYLRDHMTSCGRCWSSQASARGDEALGDQANAHKLNIVKQHPVNMGMHG